MEKIEGFFAVLLELTTDAWYPIVKKFLQKQRDKSNAASTQSKQRSSVQQRREAFTAIAELVHGFYNGCLHALGSGTTPRATHSAVCVQGRQCRACKLGLVQLGTVPYTTHHVCCCVWL